MNDGAKRTARPPIVVNGITFESYRTGVSQYTLYVGPPDDPAAWVYSNLYRATYSAAVAGTVTGKRFRSEASAMRSVAKALNSRGTP